MTLKDHQQQVDALRKQLWAGQLTPQQTITALEQLGVPRDKAQAIVQNWSR